MTDLARSAGCFGGYAGMLCTVLFDVVVRSCVTAVGALVAAACGLVLSQVHDVALLLGAGLTGLCLAGLAQVFAHLIPLTSVPLVLMIFTAYATGAVLQRTLWAAWKARVFNAVEAAAEMMMNMFFATLGASATIQELQRLGATAIGSMSCVLAVHLGILMAGRYVYNRCAANRMDTDTMLVASNACAGGAATAASMAESIKRPDLTIPAITVGLVGYVAGTRIGLVMYKFLLGVL